MKFLLITTAKKNFVKVWLCQQTSTAGSLVPPGDLVSIATVLQNHNHQVKIADLRLIKNPQFSYRKIIKEFKPDGLILNLTTPSSLEDYKLLIVPKGVYKIVFGTHAIAFPQEAFIKGVDFILWGDPEKAILNLIKSKFSPKGTVGVLTALKSKNKPALFDNLDDLPFLNLSLLELDKYTTPYMQAGKRFIFMRSSRGCPFGCTFCQNPFFFGHLYRKQSIKRMVNELEYFQKTFRIREVVYLDATFNISTHHVIQFCQEIIKRHLKILWSVNMRATPTPLKMLRWMNKAGCHRLMFGVEDFELLKGVKKRVTKKEIIQAFRRSKKAGLLADAYIMIFPDVPWDEKSYITHILEMLKEINPDAFQLNIAIPLPGTPFYNELNKKEILSNNWSWYDPGGSQKLPYGSRNNLFKIRKWVYLKYPFAQPKKAFNILFNCNPKSLIFLIKKYLEYFIK